MQILNTIPYVSSSTVEKLHKKQTKEELARAKRIAANQPRISELEEQLANLPVGADDYYIKQQLEELKK